MRRKSHSWGIQHQSWFWVSDFFCTATVGTHESWTIDLSSVFGFYKQVHQGRYKRASIASDEILPLVRYAVSIPISRCSMHDKKSLRSIKCGKVKSLAPHVVWRPERLSQTGRSPKRALPPASACAPRTIHRTRRGTH